MRPAKTQMSLGIRSVWSESSLFAHWIAEDPMLLQADQAFVGFVMRRLNYEHSEEGESQIGRLHMSRLMIKPTKWPVRPAKTQVSLGIRPVWSIFADRMKKPWVLSYPLSAQRRLWSVWVDAQADPSLHWAHRSFCWYCHAAAYIRIFWHNEDKFAMGQEEDDSRWDGGGGGAGGAGGGWTTSKNRRVCDWFVDSLRVTSGRH